MSGIRAIQSLQTGETTQPATERTQNTNLDLQPTTRILEYTRDTQTSNENETGDLYPEPTNETFSILRTMQLNLLTDRIRKIQDEINMLDENDYTRSANLEYELLMEQLNEARNERNSISRSISAYLPSE